VAIEDDVNLHIDPDGVREEVISDYHRLLNCYSKPL
jgi:hypothetical protein